MSDDRTSLERALDLPSARRLLGEEVARAGEEIEDAALDAIRVEALATFRALVEEGLNAEPRYAERYLEPAAEMLKVALECVRSSRRNAIEREKLELARERLRGPREEEGDRGEATFDRNAIVALVHDLTRRESDPEGA